MSLTDALEMGQPGDDTVYLTDGIYVEAVESFRDGNFDYPIIIEGNRHAIINGDSGWRSIVITHPFITLKVTQKQLVFFVSTRVLLANFIF